MICPCNILIAGPSQAGKSYFLLNLIKNKKHVLKPPPDRIIYCYGAWQPLFKKFPNIEFYEGLPENFDFNPKKRNMLVLDDLMDRASNSAETSDLFTKVGHHKNVTVVLIVQNLFFQGKKSRNISLNCHYLVIFKSPRDVSQIHCLARQMFPSETKVLIDSYKLATSRKHGYILIDCHPDTPDTERLRGCILPQEYPEVIYKKK